MLALSICRNNKRIIERVSFEDICDMCENPLKDKDKHSAPFIHNCDYSNNYASGGNNYEYITTFDCVVLDYDKGGISYESVKNLLKSYNYRFAIHTSYSNTNEIERFHVFIPFEKPLTIEEYNRYYPGLLKFPAFSTRHIDPSTFSRGRGFCCPIYTQNYKYFVNQGNPITIDELELHLGKISQSFCNPIQNIPTSGVSGTKPEAYYKKIAQSLITEAQNSGVDWSREGVNMNKLTDLNRKPCGTDGFLFKCAVTLHNHQDYFDVGFAYNFVFQFSSNISSIKQLEWKHKVETVYFGKSTISRQIQKYTPPTKINTFVKTEVIKPIKVVEEIVAPIIEQLKENIWDEDDRIAIIISNHIRKSYRYTKFDSVSLGEN